MKINPFECSGTLDIYINALINLSAFWSVVNNLILLHLYLMPASEAQSLSMVAMNLTAKLVRLRVDGKDFCSISPQSDGWAGVAHGIVVDCPTR